MEFKHWLNETNWKLSTHLSKRQGSGYHNQQQNLAQRAANSWMGGMLDTQKELLSKTGNTPNYSSFQFPSMQSLKDIHTRTTAAYQGKNPEEIQQQNSAVPWKKLIQLGDAVAFNQQIPNTPNRAQALNQAFEAFLQNLPRTNTNYTPQLLNYLRQQGYATYLYPPNLQADATGNLNFQFVIPKPENI
jgi:hypothetical protein